MRRILILVALLSLSSSACFTGTGRADQDREANQKRAEASPLKTDWRLGDPVSFKNLTVFPVLSDNRQSTASLITLDAGLRSGKVVVMERGGGGRLRRLRAGREPRDDADVNELMVVNRSGRTLVLIAGEIVVGGKQDRIVAEDCLIASTGRPVPLGVFCVEQGRWHENAGFGQSRSVAQNREGGGSRAGGGGGAASFAPSAGIASPNVREKAQETKDQAKVWSEVNRTLSVTETVTGTGNLSAVLEDHKVRSGLNEYERALRPISRDARVVGAVVAVGAKLRSADVFANNALFKMYWPKLIKSYSIEALTAEPVDSAKIDRRAAMSFLTRVEGRRADAGKATIYQLVEHQSDAAASFELIAGRKSPVLVHFNRFEKE